MKTPEEIEQGLKNLEEFKELNRMVLTKEEYVKMDKNRLRKICEDAMTEVRTKYPEGSKEIEDQELENKDFYDFFIEDYEHFTNKDYKELLSHNKDREVELTLEYKYGITEFKSEDPSNIFDIIKELKKVQIDEEDKAKINAFIRKEKRIRVDYDKMVKELAERGMTIEDLDNECFSLDSDTSKLFDSNGKYIRN